MVQSYERWKIAGMNMVLSRIIPSVLMTLCLALNGCYHMRAEPEPIAPLVFTVNQGPVEALRIIRKVLADDRQLRILHEQEQGTILITAPWHFATDTGFGQPAGGRRYYTQLLIEARVVNSRTRVTLSPHHYEIRSTYAYGQNGLVETLNKHYPYEEYPGMFNNNLLSTALGNIAGTLQKACRD